MRSEALMPSGGFWRPKLVAPKRSGGEAVILGLFLINIYSFLMEFF